MLSKFRYKEPKRRYSATHRRSTLHVLDVRWRRIQGMRTRAFVIGSETVLTRFFTYFRLSRWTEMKSGKSRNNGRDWCEKCLPMLTFSASIFQWTSMFEWRRSCWVHAFWLYVFNILWFPASERDQVYYVLVAISLLSVEWTVEHTA